MTSDASIRWFDDIGIDDVATVGGKNASLGEMTRALAPQGIRLPAGFATTAAAYHRYVDENGLGPVIEEAIRGLREGRLSESEASARIQERFAAADLPADLVGAVKEAYAELGRRLGEHQPLVAVRSSATAEDLPSASFAGQQESYLGVSGAGEVLEAVRKCFASLFTARAIAYRERHGFSHLEVALSAGVQQLVCWPPESAGVAFTVEPESGFPNVILVEAAWGSGEAIVQGQVAPDTYSVFKPVLHTAPSPVIGRSRGSKLQKKQPGGELVDTSPEEREAFVLTTAELIELATWCERIEAHYGRPMDIEWAKDAASGELYIVQARPMTAPGVSSPSTLRTFTISEDHGPPLLTGLSVGRAVASGRVRLAGEQAQPEGFEMGDVLVAKATSPDLVPVMRRASAIVTETGGRTSHAAIVSRELGVPAVVGAAGAMGTLSDGQLVTVSCAEGSTGYVYEGEVPWEEAEEETRDLPATSTQIMINLAVPQGALRWWALPADGVGLARIEFIVANQVKAHPMAILEPDQIEDEAEREEIRRLVRGFDDPGEYFVTALSEGIAAIAASRYPGLVLVRTSDFKTNEYARLPGGRAFEPHEENPMLGWRGASRYYDERYLPAFRLECRAIRRAREAMGLANIAVLIPFCRTTGEADKVLAAMETEGLVRGRNGLKLYLMCEIPSNVVLAAEFAERFDGFSIGSNDLTQLVLGVDRDSARLRELFDEEDPAVESMIRQLIETAHRSGATVGICGQAPSDSPAFAAFLVECGIDSISVNPDTFARTKRIVAETEGRLGR